jgi:hypothetical protein
MRHPREIELLEDLKLLSISIDLQIARIIELLTPSATSAVLSTSDQGDIPMATEAILTFTPAGAAPPKGDGSGLVVTFASDNPNVTIGTATASGDTATAPITGTEAFNLSAVVANTSGAPLLDDDGTTPFNQPTPIPVEAVVVPATGAVLSVQ